MRAKNPSTSSAAAEAVAPIAPMLLCAASPPPLTEGRPLHRPFSEPGWLYEIKHDGYRTLAGIAEGACRLKSRRGADATRWFPEVAESLSNLPGGPHVLDGEIAVIDALGRTDFMRLQARARARRWWPGADDVVYFVFDLLVANGQDLRKQPLRMRKVTLKALLSSAPLKRVLYVDDVADGVWLYRHVLALALEGIVAKRKESLYRSGERSRDWLKVPRPGAVPPQRFKR